MARIGIMGGTFDPIHNGHLMLAKQAMGEYDLDEVWFMPSGHPPHKKDHAVTDANTRAEMVRLAIRGFSRFVCSEFEITRSGNTYTAQTLTLLKQEYPEDTFCFIIGADSLYQLERWYHPEIVMELAELLVAGRAYNQEHRDFGEQIAWLKSRYGAKIRPLHCGQMNIASAEIRQMVRDKKDIRALVPKAVADYIKSRGLYAAD